MQMGEQKIVHVKELPLFIDNLIKNHALLESSLQEKDERSQSLENAVKVIQGILKPFVDKKNQKEEIEGNEENKVNGRKNRSTHNQSSEEEKEMDDSNLCQESDSESDSEVSAKKKTKEKKNKPMKIIAKPTPKKSPAPKKKQPRDIEGFIWDGGRDENKKPLYQCVQCRAKPMRGDYAEKHKC